MADTPNTATVMANGGWTVPALTADMTFRDIGQSGLRQYGGWVREEFLPQLTGLQAARTYREMQDNSSTVASVLFAITQTMRKVEWRVQPANDTPQAQAEADFLETVRNDMSHTWEDFVSEALSMLGYGFAPHEIVYKRRLGKQAAGNGRASSNYTDGRIGWRRLPLRGQDTVIKWFFDNSGTVLGLTQQPYVGTLIDLPIEKMLLFRPSQHKGNPEGRSLLRPAYRPYYFIKRLEEIEAIMIERFGGLPTLYVPSTLLEAAATNDTNALTAVQAYQKILRNVRVDEQMGLMLPSDTYQGPNGPSSVRMYEFKLETPAGGRGTLDPEKPIERYKLEILMTVLADFIQLGHAARGTQNLALSKVDMFLGAIEGWMNSVAAVINRYGVPRLWALNHLNPDLMPELVPDLATRIDLDSLGNYILHLAQSGMTMFPDEDLESYLRDAAGLPDIADADALPATGGATNTEALKKILLASGARRVRKSRGLEVT